MFVFNYKPENPLLQAFSLTLSKVERREEDFLLLLEEYRRAGCSAFFSQEYLAYKYGVSVRTISRMIANLRSKGLITVRHRYLTTSYYILTDVAEGTDNECI